jgi:hypothetical protein
MGQILGQPRLELSTAQSVEDKLSYHPAGLDKCVDELVS